MNSNLITKPIIFSILLSISALYGCSEETGTNKSPKDVQFLSHIDQAKFYQKQGQLQESVQEARNAMKIQPSRLESYIVIFETLLLSGDPVTVEKQINELLNKKDVDFKENERQLKFLLAKSLFIQQKIENSQLTIDQLVATYETLNEKESLLQGDVYLAKKDLVKANQQFKDILLNNPGNQYAQLGLSKSAFLEKQVDLAHELVTQITALKNPITAAWLWKAQLALFNNNYEESEESYIRALEDMSSLDIMTPQKYTAITALVHTLRQQSKIAEASRYQDILDRSIPGEIKLRFETALNLFKEKKYKSAVDEIALILEKSPGHRQSNILLGVIKNAQGDPAEAERLLSIYVDHTSKPEIIKLLASLQLKLNKPSSAVTTLQAAISNNNSDLSMLSLLGISQIESGLSVEGNNSLKQALSKNPEDINLRLSYAKVLNQNGEKKAALELTKETYNKAPDNLKVVSLYVFMLTELENTDKAVEVAKDWQTKNSQSANGYYLLGSVYLSNKQYDQAIKQFEKSKSIKSSPLTLVNLGKSHIGNNQKNKAFDYFQQAIIMSPESLVANRAYFGYVTAQNTADQALTIYQNLVDSAPSAVLPRLAQAELNLRQGNFDKTIDIVIAKDLSSNNQAQTLLKQSAMGKAEQLVTTGKFEEAKAFIDELITKQGESDLQLNLLLADIYYRSGDNERALTLIDDLKKTNITSSLPYEFLGSRLFSDKKFEEAIDQFSQAWQLEPSERLAIKMSQTLQNLESNESSTPLEDWLKTSPDSPRAMTMLAMNYQQEGKSKQAIALYERLLVIHPSNAVAMNNLAWLYHELNDPKAITLARKASEIASESPSVLDTYGWILFNNGQIEEAKPVLEKAFMLDKNSDEIKMHLEKVHKALEKPFDPNKTTLN